MLVVYHASQAADRWNIRNAMDCTFPSTYIHEQIGWCIDGKLDHISYHLLCLTKALQMHQQLSQLISLLHSSRSNACQCFSTANLQDHETESDCINVKQGWYSVCTYVQNGEILCSMDIQKDYSIVTKQTINTSFSCCAYTFKVTYIHTSLELVRYL